mgnify:FL=1
MADFVIDDTVDITDVVCPTTFVKAKVCLLYTSPSPRDS